MLTVFILLTECYSFSSLFVRYILSKYVVVYVITMLYTITIRRETY